MSEIEEEDQKTQLVGGIIEREYWGWDHKSCVLYCRDSDHYHKPTRKHRACQNCYGKITVRPIEGTEIPPDPGFFMRFTAWFDAWLEVRRRILDDMEDRRRNSGRWRRWSEPCDNCARPAGEK